VITRDVKHPSVIVQPISSLRKTDLVLLSVMHMIKFLAMERNVRQLLHVPKS